MPGHLPAHRLAILTGLFILALSAPPAMAAPRKAPASVPPACATPSHERLLLRPGRDICAPTLSPSGRPTAAGFLPTECPLPTQTYRIDAFGLADRCIASPHPEN